MPIEIESGPFDIMEAHVKALGARVPDLPQSEILLCRLLMHLGREAASMLEQQIRPFGLAEAEFRVLMTMFAQAEGIAHPSDLCLRASQSPANMSRICDALVARELITRVHSEHDRRRMVLRITLQGEDLVRKLLPNLWVPLKQMLSGFSAQQQLDLIAQLKRLAQSVPIALAGPTP